MSTSRWRKRLHYHRELESGAQDGLKTTLTYKVLEHAHQQHTSEVAISNIPKPLLSTITLRSP